MLAHTGSLDDWREAQGGFRGSHLLLLGAVTLALGAVLSLFGSAEPGTLPPPRAAAMVADWSVYIFGLCLVGLGFAWTCTVGILPRVGFAPAVLHLMHGGFLLCLLCGQALLPCDPGVLSATRLASLVVFAVVAAATFGRRLAVSIAAAAAAGCAKDLIGVLSPGALAGVALDAVLLLVFASTLFLLARRLRHLEDDWARRNRGGRRTDFSEFNNPQHQWNRPDDRPGLSSARSVS